MSLLFATKKSTYYFNSDKPSEALRFGKKLREMISEHMDSDRDIVILCIGSDRSTGDSLGPLTGYKLSHMNISSITIYGDLSAPVHAVNLADAIRTIRENHDNPFVIAIDASLGTSDHIGFITLSNHSLKPGLGVKKSLPAVGDISITGIVNTSGIFDNMLLQSTRLNLVMTMADIISAGIFTALP